MSNNSLFLRKIPMVFKLSALAASVALAQGVMAEDDNSFGLEEVVVTAEKRASTVQDTPIAVSAFDAGALEMRQIATTSDLQFSVPNMLFSKTNFSGSNIAIRGVGNSAVGSSADAGVGVHINDVYLNAPKIFETEFYDMERLEVLRGPQGTLYGRNTTAGVLNLITQKPTDEFEGNVSVDVGDYDTRKITGVVNLPITENIATRLAVYGLKRDGYTKNIFTDNDIDDRDMWSARWTTSFQFDENTSANLMVSYFEEDDSRSRVNKQLCTKDDRGAFGLGCSPDSKGFSFPDDQSTIGTVLQDLITAQSIFQQRTDPGNVTLPQYGASVSNQSGAALTYAAALKDPFTQLATSLFLQSEGLSEGDAGYEATLAAVTADFEAKADAFQATAFDDVDAVDSFENSLNPTDLRKVNADFDPEYYADELLINLELMHDFGEYTLTSISSWHETDTEQLTDYDWAVPSVNLDTPITYNINGREVVANFNQGVDSSNGETEQWSQQFRLISDFDGQFNFTAGAYYMNFESDTHYEVFSSGLAAYAQAGGRASLLSTIYGFPTQEPLDIDQYDTHTKYEVTTWAIFGEGYYDIDDDTKLTVGIRYSDETKETAGRLYYVDLGDDFNAPFKEQEEDWQEVTGKIGIDHNANLSFTDETLLYATVARGYKGGGFNTPSTVPGLYSDTFEPEYINSIEFGAKNRMMDNRLQANFSVFYYDYKGLQVSQIVNQSSVNENVDAKVQGLEAEFMFAPNANWLMSLNLSYLDAELGDNSTVDSSNPAQGGPNINIFGNIVAIDPATGDPGANTEVDLKGNQLPNSPEFSVNAFVDYTQDLNNGMSVVYHLDYFWQDEYYTRNFNTDADTIDSWSVSNASITLNSVDQDWFVKAWVKNLQGDDNITGHYVTDGVSGFFTNAFILEPRTFGLTLGTEF